VDREAEPKPLESDEDSDAEPEALADAPDDDDDLAADDDLADDGLDDVDATVDERWAIEEGADWGVIAAADAAAIAPPERVPRLGDPGTWARRLVIIQVLLVAAGSAPWWALLYFDSNWEAAELAWLFAAAFGPAVALYGHSRRLGRVTAFGLVTTGLVALLQMRGAGMLFTLGLGVFTAALIAAIVVSALLAILAVREVDMVT
jgi:hypothetical protein